MFTLENDQLAVEILDPVADAARFGVRYCTGGYIFQVHDRRHGALLSGPTWPESFNWFDGQGLPEAFNLQPLDADGASLIPGIGQCDLGERTIVAPCAWQVRRTAGAWHFDTSHLLGPYQLELARHVSLSGRTVRSATRITSHGRGLTPLRWFPHPFFPQPDGPQLCKLNIAVDIPADAGYLLDDAGWIARRGAPVPDGSYAALAMRHAAPLVIAQRHPLIGIITAFCSYTPTTFPIWGNGRTFSWEPFLEQTLAPGQTATWSIDYEF